MLHREETARQAAGADGDLVIRRNRGEEKRLERKGVRARKRKRERIVIDCAGPFKELDTAIDHFKTCAFRAGLSL